ncbi:hypothetical protein [Wenyingzhuangia marina]|uniref:Uncharacterized protein n=2 Tax=Wenyingzhuangia marina TaxID=1195760 RepID=A0A1M5V8C8_9FLAO|nr:hypothetical protein [Wenyingzhuangia marina]GGF73743.1 hypothetical protein GCM10011397_15830 [Wenyingzhuangia marina]SHH71475.1 hypothetical protein SAMN05444281_1596 [Wenyingzhuangia marina]
MKENQSFNLNTNFMNNFSYLFVKLVFIIIITFLIIMVINFLRDKFINQEKATTKNSIIDLIFILNKLFYISGFGFVIANIFQMIFSKISDSNSRIPNFKITGEWEYLTFGIIIIFIGISFKVIYKTLSKKEKEDLTSVQNNQVKNLS